MRVPDSKIAEVAAAADIVQVISDYVDLKKAGKDYRGLCPFHGDKDPSFYVSPHKGIFHCFGCATGGSVFSFLMKIENVSFVEAVRMVAQRYGVPFTYEPAGKRGVDDREKLLKALQIAHRYFKDALSGGEIARGYLEGRGVPAEWVARLGLGFAPDLWEGLHNSLRQAGVHSRDAVAAGLIRPRPGEGFYDHFRSRIMIPIVDLNGNLVAFGGRILGDGDPKYLNSPESQVFHKKNVLYGLESAREAIRSEGFVVLVEGYFDQISLRIRGVENTVAPLGTSLAKEQVRLIKRFSEQVITVFDGDEAGLRAVKRSIPLFLSEGLEPRCLILREHKDPDEAVRKIGIDGFRTLLDSAVPIIDFLLESVRKQYDVNTIQGRNGALEECLPVIREIADSKERDYLIERFASRIRINEARVRSLMNARGRPRPQEALLRHGTRRNLFDFRADERNVVRGMVLRDGFIDRVIASGVVKDLEEPVLRVLAERMIAFRQETGRFDPIAFCGSLEDSDLASVVAGWLQPTREENDLSPEIEGDLLMEHSLDSIRMRKLQMRKTEIQERMKRCAPGEKEYESLAEELRSLGRRLHK